MIIGGFYNTPFSWSIIMQNILLFPLLLILLNVLLKIIINPKVIFFFLIYSAAISLIISIGGLFTINSVSSLIFNLLFLPITIQFLLWFINSYKDMKKRNTA
jgi:hypothetical protein